MDRPKIQRYDDHEIERKAALVLKNAFPQDLPIPIDIDLLAECHELMDNIIPASGLDLKFDVAAVLICKPEGRFDILIDQDSCNYQPLRANFSIAHEFGHIVLHPRIWGKCKTIDDTVHFHKSIEHDYKYVERAANRLASAVLMPASTLSLDVSKLYQGLAPQNNYDDDAVFHKLRSFLANKYSVTTKPMEIRLKELKLEQRIRTALKNQSPYL